MSNGWFQGELTLEMSATVLIQKSVKIKDFEM